MYRTALIVAGGKGLRMGSELPKQFLPIGGNCVKRMDLTSGMKLPMEVKPVSTRLKTDWL